MKNQTSERRPASRLAHPTRPVRPSRTLRSVLLALCLAVAACLPAEEPKAEQILAWLDQSQTFDTSFSTGVMAIQDRMGTRKTEFQISSRGKHDTFIEFTSAAEAGQKILRTQKEMYLFFPDSEQVTRLQGAALRQSMAGSDIAYEDLTGNRNRGETYTAVLEGTAEIDSRPCWHLLLTAKSKNVAYPTQEVWVDKTNHLPVIVKSFALSGKELKEIHFYDVVTIGAFPYSTRLLVRDKLKSGSSTELVSRDIKLNSPIPGKVFTLENLSW
jgi:outer membrane lipoprotein-sorting protein